MISWCGHRGRKILFFSHVARLIRPDDPVPIHVVLASSISLTLPPRQVSSFRGSSSPHHAGRGGSPIASFCFYLLYW